jgi:hypothetical protein
VVLPDHVAESLRPILSRYNLIGHSIYDLRFTTRFPDGYRERWSIASRNS